ncbi:carboxylesterase family protein [Streptosporangium sp. NPDC049248]|uniref:carboxylesterase/lipase family protein n=1 Tax=Streptosporangium sp. NPDC049248 TaxID=3155651 RepID=UPI0034169E51
MDIIAATRHGKVRGLLQDGIAVFRGIPYAAAPFGAERFRTPAPVQPWEGVRDALKFGPTAPKRPYRPPLDRLIPEERIPGDECLNLNVWTPGVDDGARPVMVWIHGGSLRNGSSSPALYDGHAFARDGVVLVSINYRLGVEGFGVFPDAPDNRGLLDQLAALEWVRDNVAAFGGDPGNVTVFGESAGAISIGALLTSPRAKGLFHRAIMQSGPPHTVTREEAGKTVKLMAAKLGVPPTAEAFAAVDRERLLDAQVEVVGKADPITGGPGFHIVAEPGSGPVEVDLLIGANREEYRLWFVPTGAVDRINRLTLRLALLKFRIPSRVARLYRSGRPGAKPGEILGEMATDLLLRGPLNRLADAVERAYVYEFAWRSPVMDLGSCHGLEIGFVFDNLRHGRELAGDGAPQELADAMHRAWVAFAATGDPGWQRWDSSRPVMIFDSPDSGVVHAPRDEELRVWLDRGR